MFGRSYNYLANEALQAKRQIWALVPELHQSQHLFIEWPSRGLNPRFFLVCSMKILLER